MSEAEYAREDPPLPPARYIVKERRWPFKPPLQRPWALVWTLDGKPVGFYKSEREALQVLAAMPR